jgi:hypothetical protein
VSAEEVRISVRSNIPIVRATERLWVRLSVSVVAVVGLLTGLVLFPPQSEGTRVYVLGMVTLLVAGLGGLAAFRHVGVARAAREHRDKSGDLIVVLFDRAALYAPGLRRDLRPVGKGWLSLAGPDVTIWEAGNVSPIAGFARAGALVEPAQGSPFTRPLARFLFEDGSEVHAVVVRHGFGHLRGWSAADIRALSSQLYPLRDVSA